MSAPWRYLTQKQAAKVIGVDFELLAGVASAAGVRVVESEGKSGGRVYLFNAEDIKALQKRMEAIQ